MARARMTDMGSDLSSLLEAAKTPKAEPDSAPQRQAEKDAPARAAKPRSATSKADIKPSSRPAKSKTADNPRDKPPVAVDADHNAEGPRYLTLMRKETRIPQAQADQLSSIARSLNMTRKGRGERLTDNTLIRVAIGLLLERRDELHGTTEAELFQSLGLDPLN